jgi:hypothetical protein
VTVPVCEKLQEQLPGVVFSEASRLNVYGLMYKTGHNIWVRIVTVSGKITPAYHTERGDTPGCGCSELPNNLHNLLRPNQKAAQFPEGSSQSLSQLKNTTKWIKLNIIDEEQA